jgi:hypothetical protein
METWKGSDKSRSPPKVLWLHDSGNLYFCMILVRFQYEEDVPIFTPKAISDDLSYQSQ